MSILKKYFIQSRCTPSTTSRRHLAGYSIVELMVAITIGLVILAAVSQIFVTSRATYSAQEGMARVQEGGRFAMEFLATDIRMAGYTGCNSNLTLGAPNGSGDCSEGQVCNIVTGASDGTLFSSNGIQGHRYTGSGTALSDWTPSLPGYFSAGEVKAGTDVIVLQQASSLGTHLTGNTTPSNANVQVLGASGVPATIMAGDILFITDCKSGDIFKTHQNGCTSTCPSTVTIAHTTGNTQNFLTHRYSNEAELMKMITRVYYIGTNATSGETGLWRKELVAGAMQGQELVQGVDDMRILYGFDNSSSPNRDYVPDQYLPANSIVDWSKVVTARVGLLVRTPDKVGDADTNTYNVLGTSLGPYNDKRRRHVFDETVQIRNAGI